jgi:hypothetical protein
MTTPHRRAHRLMNAGVVWSISRTPSDHAWTGNRIGVRYARHHGGPTGGASRRAGCRSCSTRRSPGGVCPRRTIPGHVRRLRSRRSRDAQPDGRTHSQDVDRSLSGIPPCALRRGDPGRSRLDSRDVRIGSMGDPGANSLFVCGPLDGWPHRSATSTALVHRNGATVPPLLAMGAEARLDAQIDAPLLSRESSGRDRGGSAPPCRPKQQSGRRSLHHARSNIR